MNYIREIKTNIQNIDKAEFYTHIPALAQLNNLKFDMPVTFFVGENGSGKSTLLEAIAVAYGLNPEGGSKNFNFATNRTHSSLHTYLTLSRSPYKPRDSFFLRAETFYNLATSIELLSEDDRSFLNNFGGTSFHEKSHGEGVLALIQNRFGGKGLYILDEPDVSLSPQRQLSLLYEIDKLVKDNSQFIIATHSPFLLSYPNACIYSFNTSPVSSITYEETESYSVTNTFIRNREALLKNLFQQ